MSDSSANFFDSTMKFFAAEQGIYMFRPQGGKIL